MTDGLRAAGAHPFNPRKQRPVAAAAQEFEALVRDELRGPVTELVRLYVR